MTTDNSDVRQFITDFPLREKRTYKLYWLYTVIAIILSVAWLAYSFYQVRKWQNESERLRVEVKTEKANLQRIQEEKKIRTEQLNSVAQEIGIRPDMKTYLEESARVKGELQKIKSPKEEQARRAKLLIRYYVRRNDRGRVEQAMQNLGRDYGFKVQAPDVQKEPNNYTDTIWIIRPNNIKVEDVQLVAYYMILQGVEIKYIGPPTSTPDKIQPSPESIWAVAEPKAKDEPPLTVEKIKNLTMADLKRGTKTLQW